MQGNSSCWTCLNLERSYPAPLFPQALGSLVCMFVRVEGGFVPVSMSVYPATRSVHSRLQRKDVIMIITLSVINGLIIFIYCISCPTGMACRKRLQHLDSNSHYSDCAFTGLACQNVR